MANQYGEALKGDHISIPPAQGIYETSSTKKAPLGTRVAFADGRVYRYAYNGATALVAGRPVRSIGTAQYNKTVASTATTGAYSFTLNTAQAITTATDGFVYGNDSTGEGLIYKIKTCAAGTTTTDTDITLYDPITVALTTVSEMSVMYNPYYAVVVVDSVLNDVVGVPPMAIPASHYFWLQTWGVCPVYVQGTGINGQTAYLNTSTAVGVQASALAYMPTAGSAGLSLPATAIGRFYGYVNASTEFTPVWLMIAP